MKVRIWDIKKEKWFEIDNVKHISVSKEYFKLYELHLLDHKKYKTSKYELHFIHSEI